MRKNPDLQVNVNRDLALAVFDRVGITLFLLVAAAVTYLALKH